MPAPTGSSVPVAPASHLTSVFQSTTVSPPPAHESAASSSSSGAPAVLPANIASYNGETMMRVRCMDGAMLRTEMVENTQEDGLKA